MKVSVSHPTRLNSLASQLRRAGCRVTVLRTDTIAVAVLEARTDESARVCVDAYVAAWEKREHQRGIGTRVVVAPA